MQISDHPRFIRVHPRFQNCHAGFRDGSSYCFLHSQYRWLDRRRWPDFSRRPGNSSTPIVSPRSWQP